MLELIELALVGRRETLTLGSEASYELDLALLTALLEPALYLEAHVVDLLLHARVPVVFYRVVRAALQILRDYRPFVLTEPILDVEDELLLKAPVVLLDPRIQMVVPALATLLPDAAWQVVRDVGPLLGAVALHQRQHKLVFFLAPGALDECRIEHFLPSMQALDVSAAIQTLRNLLPIFTIVALDGPG